MSSSTSHSSSTNLSTTSTIVTIPHFLGTPVITTKKLNGQNYLAWSSTVEIWFLGHGLEANLSTTISTIPEGNLPLWQQVDARLLSLLWQTIELTSMPIFRPLCECSALWTRDCELYTSDITHIYGVIDALFNLQQVDLDMTTYLGKL